MRRIALLVLVLATIVPTAATGAPTLSVQLDRTAVSSRIGRHFAFTTAIRNPGTQALPGVVAHLNILSLDPSVYVDPEDWSSSRTRYLGTLAPGQVRRVRWSVQAVNSGRFVIYAAVVDRYGAGTITASPPLRVRIAQRRTLNSSGVLPLAFGIPLALGGLLLLVRRRRRRAA